MLLDLGLFFNNFNLAIFSLHKCYKCADAIVSLQITIFKQTPNSLLLSVENILKNEKKKSNELKLDIYMRLEQQQVNTHSRRVKDAMHDFRSLISMSCCKSLMVQRQQSSFEMIVFIRARKLLRLWFIFGLLFAFYLFSQSENFIFRTTKKQRPHTQTQTQCRKGFFLVCACF